MRGRNIRDWWPSIAVAVILIAAVGLLYAVWQSPNRNDVAGYGSFAVALIALAASPISWALRARAIQKGQVATGQDLDHVADRLAIAVKDQWGTEAHQRGLIPEPIPVAWGKPSLTLAGRVSAATGSWAALDPLPGLTPTRASQLAAGQIRNLHAVYGGLKSGRLVIAGGPGSGKTGTAILLVLEALKHRDRVPSEDRAKVPVPVLFTAHEWDPHRQPVKEWLTERLQETYPLFTGRRGAANAAGLIDAGKTTLLLDGLDEIAKELRPVALQKLNEANFRVVVLSRTAEMASAASPYSPLAGAAAIELRAVAPAAAVKYLEGIPLNPPPDEWRDLIGHIRTDREGSLANALNTPLILTLIRDICQSADDDVHELLALCNYIQQHVSGKQATENITAYLLDRFVPVVYAGRPNQPPPRYDGQSAKNALEKIATRMNQENTRDLQWWRIPGWAPSKIRIIVAGLVTGLITGLVVGLAFHLAWNLAGGSKTELTFSSTDLLAFEIVIALVAVLVVVLVSAFSRRVPKRIAVVRWRNMFHPLPIMLGIGTGLLFGLAGGVGLVGALSVGLAIGISSGLIRGFSHPEADATSSLSPVTSWHSDRRYGLASGLIVGLAAGLSVGLVGGLTIGLSDGRTAGVAAGLSTGLFFGLGAGIPVGLASSLTWLTSLAFAQLARRWNLPVRLMRFLEDARQRGVLRTVGPVYQFRHRDLQDHLAHKKPAPRMIP